MKTCKMKTLTEYLESWEGEGANFEWNNLWEYWRLYDFQFKFNCVMMKAEATFTASIITSTHAH